MRNKTLNNVLAKNQVLIGGIPSSIVGDGLKQQFIKQRKGMMLRLVHSEVKNKKASEWTAKAVTKIQKNQMLNKSTRPAPVREYL